MKFFSKGNLGYLILGSLLVVYVALCTRWRDSLWGADAWEHHRAIIALTEDLWQPGNPTYATQDPSIRYSPYTVVQAAICRMTGLSPYDILSGAAVVNTLLLVVGLWGLLREFGETPSAAAALIVMVGLYGGAPGYANSYALADLPWHQVNPSAFGFALTPFLWVLFRRTSRAGRTGPALLVVSVLGAVVMLDHPMTGFFALLGLLVIAPTVPPDRYRRSMVNLSVVVGGVAILCMGWPWYNFAKAALSRPDNDYWFNKWILIQMLTNWCWPAILCGFAGLTVQRQSVRTFLLGAVFSFALGLISFAMRSPTLARLPMPALIFLHLPTAVFCHESGLLRPATWPGRVRAMVRGDARALFPSVVETMVALILISCLVPQLISVASSPHLARPYLAPLLGKPTKLVRLRGPLDRLLAGIGTRDVVLSDLETSWLIPSSRGRVIAAQHYEFFVPDQPRRIADLMAFFDEKTSAGCRLEILRRNRARWIVLNSSRITPRVFDDLMVPDAVVAHAGDLTLLDAGCWARSVNCTAPDRAHRAAEQGRYRPRQQPCPGVRAVQPPQGESAGRGLPEEPARGPRADPEASQGPAQGRHRGQRRSPGVVPAAPGDGPARRVRLGRPHQVQPHDARAAQGAPARRGVRRGQYAGRARCQGRPTLAGRGVRARQAEPLLDRRARLPDPACPAEEIREGLSDRRRRPCGHPGREV